MLFFCVYPLNRYNFCRMVVRVIGMRESPDSTRARCLSYVSACSSSHYESEVPFDKSFESAVLGCALDDQKKIRQRLSGLLDYMTKEKWKSAIQLMN